MGQLEWTEVKDLPTHELFLWKDEVVIDPEAETDGLVAEEEPLDPEEREAILERFTAHRV
jgi:hypothetical protein